MQANSTKSYTVKVDRQHDRHIIELVDNHTGKVIDKQTVYFDSPKTWAEVNPYDGMGLPTVLLERNEVEASQVTLVAQVDELGPLYG